MSLSPLALLTGGFVGGGLAGSTLISDGFLLVGSQDATQPSPSRRRGLRGSKSSPRRRRRGTVFYPWLPPNYQLPHPEPVISPEVVKNPRKMASRMSVDVALDGSTADLYDRLAAAVAQAIHEDDDSS